MTSKKERIQALRNKVPKDNFIFERIHKRTREKKCIGCAKALPDTFMTVEAILKADASPITLKMCLGCFQDSGIATSFSK